MCDRFSFFCVAVRGRVAVGDLGRWLTPDHGLGRVARSGPPGGLCWA